MGQVRNSLTEAAHNLSQWQPLFQATATQVAFMTLQKNHEVGCFSRLPGGLTRRR